MTVHHSQNLMKWKGKPLRDYNEDQLQKIRNQIQSQLTRHTTHPNPTKTTQYIAGEMQGLLDQFDYETKDKYK